jgi:O-antigen/teichoic acid export membrane protein
MLGASFLGAYTLAFSLTENLRQMLSSVLNKVMYPVFGKNQDDKLKLKGYFLKIINLNAFAIYPIMAFFLVFAEEIILTLFGDKWEMAILPLQILSVAMMVHLLVNSFTSIIRGLGKPKLELKIIMGLNIFVLLPGLYLGTMYFGLVGATYAVVLHKIGLVISAVTILDKEIDLKFTEIFRAVRNPILMITACVIIIETIFHFTVLKNVMLLAAIYGILYIFIAYRTEKRMITQLIEKLK